jgi:ABC-type transport system substrate-binding protein
MAGPPHEPRSPRRRRLIAAAGACAAGAIGPAAARPRDAPPRTLRVAMETVEVGFDPPQVSDNTSLTIVAHVFEPMLGYDPLASPAKLVPLTAAALPEVHDDATRFVFTLRPGILFADDPAFGGRPRELTAADYVFSFKRFYDPAVITEHLYLFENEQVLGLSELRRRAIDGKRPFDYDSAVEGLRVLDRYRLQIRLARPSPRFVLLFTYAQTGAVAREVVGRYGADIMAHPVGTGPFRLASWTRGSRIVLERNPGFRDQRYEADPPPGDAQVQAIAATLRGRRLPLLDRVEVRIVEEAQPRWLAFLGGEVDLLAVPPPFVPMAAPGGELAPFLARRGVQLQRRLDASVTHTYFNFDDPVVGGYAPTQVALRRAIALAVDSAEEIRLLQSGQAIPAHGLVPPHCYGYDPSLKSEASRADPARAQALLDLAGYARPGGGGARRRPDGSALVLRLASTQDQRARQRNELWQRRLADVGLALQIEIAPFGELIRRSLAGQLMMWGFTWVAGAPDADFFLGMAYGPNAGQSNDARFALPAFDRLYERQHALPDGPERLATIAAAHRLLLAYLPYIARYHSITTWLTQPRVTAYRPRPFAADWWRNTEVADR